ncbi:RagB/SusD family nutrient uptake outer membrane protein [Chitinophaga sp. MM2321]|uniref:RagB/SusD family nutrient uptake outer membrane protein n=1 Tax=Chitinophaga sp. MM2321 TaxID=3137178 RepID=UPI0032D57B59
MNRIYFLLILAILTGCAKLDEHPASFITADQFYKTKEDALSAVNSAYSNLNQSDNSSEQGIYGRTLHLTGDISSDDAIPGPKATNTDMRGIGFLSFFTTNNRVSELWRQHYQGIDRTNIAIDKIPLIEFDHTLRDRLVNESKFLRALYYFNLVRLWGGVPLVLHPTTSLDKSGYQIPRASVDEVYAQIINDLTDAENLPPVYTGNDLGRATAGAAKSLLAKVYLTRQEWDKAIQKSEEVIKGPYGYDLFENFADVFNVATKNGKEHIFSAQFKGFSNRLGNILGQRGTPIIPGISGGDSDAPTEGLYDLYSPVDKRRDVTFFTSLVSPTNGKVYTFIPHFAKYYDPAALSDLKESSKNVPVIRFAEVLLIHAEAVNEKNGPVGEAYTSINRVRHRAGLIDLPEGLNKDQFRDSVYLERRLELVYECQRWFDLVRTKRLLTQLHAWGKPNAVEKHYLRPIPQGEISANPALTQNPGWEN